MSSRFTFDLEDPSDDRYGWRVFVYPSSGRSYWYKYKRLQGRLLPLGRIEPADEYDSYTAGDWT